MEVTESQRIDELRQRVEKDPTSIAFAQLAEEYRRAGSYQDAVKVCRGGLAQHPSYVSARVTLGRALIELRQFDEARAELMAVLELAPDNLAATRALAEIEAQIERRDDAADTVAGNHEAKETAQETIVEMTIEERSTSATAVLDALTLDLPPAPDFGSWMLETTWAPPEPPAALTLSVPVAPVAPSHSPTSDAPPAPVASSHLRTPDAPVATLAPSHLRTSDAPLAPVAPSHSRTSDASVAPAVQLVESANLASSELERWLAAIVRDRAQRQ